MALDQHLSECGVIWASVLESPELLIERGASRAHPRPIESESLSVGPEDTCFKWSAQVSLHMTEVWEPHSSPCVREHKPRESPRLLPDLLRCLQIPNWTNMPSWGMNLEGTRPIFHQICLCFDQIRNAILYDDDTLVLILFHDLGCEEIAHLCSANRTESLLGFLLPTLDSAEVP